MTLQSTATATIYRRSGGNLVQVETGVECWLSYQDFVQIDEESTTYLTQVDFRIETEADIRYRDVIAFAGLLDVMAQGGISDGARFTILTLSPILDATGDSWGYRGQANRDETVE